MTDIRWRNSRVSPCSSMSTSCQYIHESPNMVRFLTFVFAVKKFSIIEIISIINNRLILAQISVSNAYDILQKVISHYHKAILVEGNNYYFQFEYIYKSSANSLSEFIYFSIQIIISNSMIHL